MKIWKELLFFQVCEKFNIPCLQIRSVSNKVEKRDLQKWDIDLAVKNLNEELEKIICSSLVKLTLAISPCPNDIFIFDAIINKKINLEGLDFEVAYKDIQSLNKDLHHLNYDIIKVSFKALMNNKDDYTLLDSGSALGKKLRTHFKNCQIQSSMKKVL